MKIKCLIIDDELAARQGLQLLCDEYPQIEVAGVSKDGVEAIDDINSLCPDLVLLDVQMPKANGFEVLNSIAVAPPQVIFITAHDEFAIKAFEVNAIDYLLKPFSDDRFDKAIRRAIAEINEKKTPSYPPMSPSLKDQSYSSDLRHSDTDRIIVKSDGKIRMIPKDSIVQVEAYDYYVKIHQKERYFLIRETMKHLEHQLDDPRFMRVHKSHIVNRGHILEFSRESGHDHKIITTNHQEIKVSRSKVNMVKEWLG